MPSAPRIHRSAYECSRCEWVWTVGNLIWWHGSWRWCFINSCFESVYLLLRVSILPLFHSNLGPYWWLNQWVWTVENVIRWRGSWSVSCAGLRWVNSCLQLPLTSASCYQLQFFCLIFWQKGCVRGVFSVGSCLRRKPCNPNSSWSVWVIVTQWWNAFHRTFCFVGVRCPLCSTHC